MRNGTGRSGGGGGSGCAVAVFSNWRGKIMITSGAGLRETVKNFV